MSSKPTCVNQNKPFNGQRWTNVQKTYNIKANDISNRNIAGASNAFSGIDINETVETYTYIKTMISGIICMILKNKLIPHTSCN